MSSEALMSAMMTPYLVMARSSSMVLLVSSSLAMPSMKKVPSKAGLLYEATERASMANPMLLSGSVSMAFFCASVS